MPRPRLIVGVDADQVGASTLAIMHPLPETAAKEQGQTRLYGAAPGWATLVQEKSEQGHPYRLELCDPGPVARDDPSAPLPQRRAPSYLTTKETAKHLDKQAKAIQFLVNQVSQRTPDRVGVVVPDDLDPDSAEKMFRALDTPRGRVDLFPWPIAATWAWLAQFGDQLERPDSDQKSVVGTVLTIHLKPDGWEAGPIHLLMDPKEPDLLPVPARDRDNDDLTQVSWPVIPFDPGRIEQCLSELCRLCSSFNNDYDSVGFVITGRPFSFEVIEAVHAHLTQVEEVGNSLVLADNSYRIGLLSRGAASAAQAVLDGKVPYYETLPQIEILGRIWSWEDTMPHGLDWLSYWINALRGIKELEDGRKFLPANRKLEHSPNIPSLTIRAGSRKPINVAFDKKFVRRIFADVPGDFLSEEPVSLRVEYRLGSGRPKVTIQRERHPTEPIVFEWDTADVVSKTRDELSKFDDKTVQVEHKRREQLRRARGYVV